MTDILLLIPALACLWGLRFCRGLNTECLSRRRTDSLRGALALGIIFTHIGQFCPGGPLLALAEKSGCLLVGLFFFLSGYGLQKQHITREDYHKGFLRKRFFGVLLPYLVLTGVYWSYYNLIGRGYGLMDILTRFAQGTPIVSFSWFIPGVLSFYLAFWALMRLCKRGYSTMVLGGAVWFAVYTLICLALNFGHWWYVSAFPAVVGMAWATHEEAIVKTLKKRYWLILLPLLAALAAATAGENLLPSGPWSTLLKACATTLFAISCVLILYKVRLCNPVLELLGQLSMELYLTQGLAIMLLRSRWIYVESPVLYALLILVLTVVFAMIVHIAFKGVPKKQT